MPRVNIELVAGTQQFELAMRKSQSEVAKLAAGIAQADARISKANATIAKASAVIATSDASAAKANATIASLGTSAERTSVQLNAMGAAGTKAGLHMVSGMQASSAAIRVMEGGMTNNLRAVERFVSGTLGLGPILQKIFPVVGALAFTGLMVKLGTEVYNFFKNMEAGPARIANAFRELNAPIEKTNDELRVTNDRLANDIAKLEGKRQNTLALALDEAKVAADSLADALEKDLKSLNKLLSEENIGALKGFFTNQASTTALRDYLGGEKGFTGFASDIAGIDEKGREKIGAAKTEPEKRDATIALNTELEKKYGEAIGFVSQKLKEAETQQAARDEALKRSARGEIGTAAAPLAIPEDQSSYIGLARGALRTLRAGPQRPPTGNTSPSSTPRTCPTPPDRSTPFLPIPASLARRSTNSASP